MMARMPGAPPAPAPDTSARSAVPAGPEFRIVIPDPRGGEPLLTMYQDDHGRLAAEYDPGRVTEAAVFFLDAMRQWSGQVGIRWQDEVEKAVRP
jgi:hypothetical protein